MQTGSLTKMSLFSDVPTFHSFVKQSLSKVVSPIPRKVQILTEMLSPKSKTLHSFLGILNYLNKFSLAAAEVYKPL